MKAVIKEYSNPYASVERMSDGTFDLFNDVTGEYEGTVQTWREAQAHLQETQDFYTSGGI